MFEYQIDLKEAILNLLSEEQIFKKYCPNFRRIGQKFFSEFREEKNPSCYIIRYRGKLIYKDFGEYNSYDCFGYIQRKYNIDFHESLEMVYNDFVGLVNLSEVKVKPKQKYDDRPNIIKVKYRNWNQGDIQYWNSYGITLECLKDFKVFPIEYYITNNKGDYFIRYNTPLKTYAYYLGKNKLGIQQFKIYRPDEDALKWRSNCSRETIQGLSQIPQIGCYLIITSSLKDVMALKCINVRFNAIAPSSENILISSNYIDYLSQKYTKIVILMNNDVAGLKSMQLYNEAYGMNGLILPFSQKDPSDVIKAGNGSELNNWLLNKLQ